MSSSACSAPDDDLDWSDLPERRGPELGDLSLLNSIPFSRSVSAADFRYHKCLGNGAFARVMLAEMKSSGEFYAVKVINKDNLMRHNKVETAIREYQVLSNCQFPHIIRLYHAFQDSESVYFVLELADGGDLFSELQLVHHYPHRVAVYYLAQLVLTLEFLHCRARVAHRDLKPENMMKGKDGRLLLCDFGTSKAFSGTESSTHMRKSSFVGTAAYVAPEILNPQPNSEAPGLSVDLWSLGVIVFQFLTGRLPFQGGSEYLTFQKILSGTIQWPDEKTIEKEKLELNEQAKDLIRKLLVVDPSQRFPASEAGYAALKSHPFFAGVDWAGVSKEEPPPIGHDFDDPESSKLSSQLKGLGLGEGRGRSDSDSQSGNSRFLSSQRALSASASPACSTPQNEPAGSDFHSVNPRLTDLVNAQLSSSLHCVQDITFQKFLEPGEQILLSGQVVKRRGIYARKRQLILTSAPRFFYVDPSKGEFRKDIKWCAQLWAELKDEKTFLIHIPKRDYYMVAIDRKAFEWVKIITKIQNLLQLNQSNTSTPSSSRPQSHTLGR